MEKLLTAKQLAEILQVDLSTIYWWSHTEFIPYVKLGKCVRFRESEVESWLKERGRSGRKAMKYAVGLTK